MCWAAAIPVGFWGGSGTRPQRNTEQAGQARLEIISMTLQPGEDLIVGNRLRQILNKARKQSASA